MHPRTEIDKPSRAYEFVVYGVPGVVFRPRVAHSEGKGIVCRPPANTHHRTLERPIHRHNIAEARRIVYRFQQSPVGISLAMHRHTVVHVVFHPGDDGRIVIVGGIVVAVTRRRRIAQSHSHGGAKPAFQPLFLVRVGGNHPSGHTRYLYTQAAQECGVETIGMHVRWREHGQSEKQRPPHLPANITILSLKNHLGEQSFISAPQTVTPLPRHVRALQTPPCRRHPVPASRRQPIYLQTFFRW